MRILLPLLLSLPLQGCIIYDSTCGRNGCDDESSPDGRPDTPCDDPSSDCTDPGDPGDPTDTSSADTATGETGTETSEPEPTWSFTLTPGQAEAGEVFIGSLRTVGEDAPTYDQIAAVHFYGDVTVLAADTRSWEYLVTLQVAADAEPQTVDLVVELADGTAAWVDDVLTLYATGSGHSASSSDDGSTPCE